jgi:ATP-dependent helicase/nuclease subunit A
MSQANTIIRASAGTGKTFQLANRFLKLLLQGAAADEILATTFTRKAAAEILSIVLDALFTVLNPRSCSRAISSLFSIPICLDNWCILTLICNCLY